jgi:two-component system, LuxR family, sensor kinase FixL
MNWVQLAWVIMAASSLTLGAIHLLIWFKQKTELSHLLFFVLATSAATFGAFELALMQ